MRAIDADELKTAFPVCDNSKPVLIASVRATINHMPTIEPEPHWTFCKERLPKKTGWYAVIDDSGGAKFVETSYYREEDGLDPFWEFVNPVAWMSIELPKPYQEDES